MKRAPFAATGSGAISTGWIASSPSPAWACGRKLSAE
jgi:hypothetical protein